MLLVYIVLFVFVIATIKSILFWVYLWQVKEYRFDRFWAEFGTLGKIFRFVLFAGGRKLRVPKRTLKACGILLTDLFILALFVYYFLGFFYFGLFPTPFAFAVFVFAVAYLFVPLIVASVILLFRIPTVIIKQSIYNRAAKKIAGTENLVVIGITGSYGKSSTKEFLAQILAKKFEVIKTPENVNTEIGVARFVLENMVLDSRSSSLSLRADGLRGNDNEGGGNANEGVGGEKTIFIVEMGAYRVSEIKRICDIVRPKIGIITGINEQHLSMFGSLENIMKAKYELIESLPEDGLAVFNGENKYCRNMADRWTGKKIIYRDANIRTHANDTNMPKHYWQNLAGAIAVAKHLGMGEDEINEAVKSIKLTDKMMKSYIGKGGALIIDDIYSANPDGVLAGLDYLAQQPQKIKIVVMPCLIELGREAEEVHRRIGRKINEVCDLAIITTGDYFDIIREEAGNKAILATTPERTIELLKDKLNSDTAVLLEGRLAERVVEFVK